MAKKQEYPVQTLCETLEVSRSGYYAHLRKQERPRRRYDEELKPLIEKSFKQSKATYGALRIGEDLKALGHRVGTKRIRRLAREQRLFAVQKRRFRIQTTDSDHAMPVAPNYLGQVPAPDETNRVWTSDITYIHTREDGVLYLAAVMDLFSRRIIGWCVSDTMHTILVESALWQAVCKRLPVQGLIHHSDRGSQYCSNNYRRLLAQHHITASMSRKGNCYDNAYHESFWATLKTECFGKEIPLNRKQVEAALFNYIECFYNLRRRHSALGYLSPDQFEHQHRLSQAPAVPRQFVARGAQA